MEPASKVRQIVQLGLLAQARRTKFALMVHALLIHPLVQASSFASLPTQLDALTAVVELLTLIVLQI